MPLAIGRHQVKYSSVEDSKRAQARDEVIAEMRVSADKRAVASESKRRAMEKAVAELRRKRTY